MTNPTAGTLVEAMEASLLSGDWMFGQQLPAERLMAESFGVGRPLVREVLRRLSERGLVVTVPGRGTFVRELRPSDGVATPEVYARRGSVTIRQVIEARRALECEAASLAARRRTPDDLAVLGEIVTAMERAEGLGLAAELDVAFHQAVVDASKNTVFQILFGSIRSLTAALAARSHLASAVNDASFPYHRTTYEAIASADAEGARRALGQHFTLGEERYGADLDRPVRDGLPHSADTEPRLARLLRRSAEMGSAEMGSAELGDGPEGPRWTTAQAGPTPTPTPVSGSANVARPPTPGSGGSGLVGKGRSPKRAERKEIRAR
ncbi:MAG: FadR/GntR family transcriptional regulator [Acidimicrobiales bacterium]